MQEEKKKQRERKLLRVFRTQLEEMLRRIRTLGAGREEVYDILLKSLTEVLQRKEEE